MSPPSLASWAEKDWVLPLVQVVEFTVQRVVLEGVMVIVGEAVTVTDADPDLLVSACEVAITLTLADCRESGMLLGAV